MNTSLSFGYAQPFWAHLADSTGVAGLAGRATRAACSLVAQILFWPLSTLWLALAGSMIADCVDHGQ